MSGEEAQAYEYTVKGMHAPKTGPTSGGMYDGPAPAPGVSTAIYVAENDGQVDQLADEDDLVISSMTREPTDKPLDSRLALPD